MLPSPDHRILDVGVSDGVNDGAAEHHTALPLAHYQPHTFKIACRLTGQDDWAKDENLILMTRKRLWRIAAPLGRAATVGYTGLRLRPFSLNLFLIID